MGSIFPQGVDALEQASRRQHHSRIYSATLFGLNPLAIAGLLSVLPFLACSASPALVLFPGEAVGPTRTPAVMQRPALDVTAGPLGAVNVQGWHFSPDESVELFFTGVSAPSISDLTLIGTVHTSTEGHFNAGAITLPPHKRGEAYLVARGAASGYTQSVAIPIVADTPTPQLSPTMPPTPTPLPRPTSTPPPNATLAALLPDPNSLWLALFYANRDLGEPAVITRTENNATIHFRTHSSPAPGVPPTRYSVTWTKQQTFTSLDSYLFEINASDGVRLYIIDPEGHSDLVINEWRITPLRVARGSRTLQPGIPYTLRVDYFYNGSAPAARLDITWTVQYTGWEARYYNSTDMDGDVIYRRDDSPSPDGGIDVTWEGAPMWNGTPVPGVSTDNFAVDWERQVYFQCACIYRFSADFDDGMRVYIDSVLLFDNLAPGSATHIDANRSMRVGKHFVEVHYVERSGSARARLSWQADCNLPTPAP
jgi:hypothetical protein